MWISCFWHDSCNYTPESNPELMKMTITINLVLILLYYFLLSIMLPF